MAVRWPAMMRLMPCLASHKLRGQRAALGVEPQQLVLGEGEFADGRFRFLDCRGVDASCINGARLGTRLLDDPKSGKPELRPIRASAVWMKR